MCVELIKLNIVIFMRPSIAHISERFIDTKRITNTVENLKQIKGPLLVMSRVVQLLLMHHALRRLSARLVRPAMRHLNRSVLWQTQVVLTRALKKKGLILILLQVIAVSV